MKTRIAIVGILLCVIGVLVGRQARHAAEPAAKPAAAVRAVPGARLHAPVRDVPEAVLAEAAAEELPLPDYAPRDPVEWQGMLVNVAMQAECIDSSTCGLAMACIDHRCGPCSEDSQCGSGEACVLDHCVAADQVACRSRTDCTGVESLCILSGYSSDPRGNGEMTASCHDAASGTEQDFARYVPPETLPADPVPVPPGELLDSLPDDPA